MTVRIVRCGIDQRSGTHFRIRLWPRIKRWTKAGIDKDADQQHAAVHARAFDVGAVVVRRAYPRARLGNNRGALHDFALDHRVPEIWWSMALPPTAMAIQTQLVKAAMNV